MDNKEEEEKNKGKFTEETKNKNCQNEKNEKES